MNPFYFGGSDQRLFGIYHAGRSGAGRPDSSQRRAVVLCNPWGPEYIHAHRTVRLAANMLTNAGFHTLRFDYFGTGDSAGDMPQASIPIWEDNIRAALREVMEMSGTAKATLIGLRLGALLAARVAAASPELIDRLVLWDPIVDGRLYLKDLLKAARAEIPLRRGPLPRPASDGGGHEVLGHPITASLAREIADLDMRPLAADLPRQICVLLSGKRAEVARVERALVPPLTPSAIERIAGPPCWIEYWPPSERCEPVALLKRLVEWSKPWG
jgi:pimeloyl-ACP methyl ester carboxylesterase